jgi:hypothetical protein
VKKCQSLEGQERDHLLAGTESPRWAGGSEMYCVYLTKGPVIGSIGEGQPPMWTKRMWYTRWARGCEMYSVHLTKGLVTGRAGEGPLTGVDRAMWYGNQMG